MVIMVVDDHHDTREMLAEVLEQGGHAVIAANNGRNAIDLLTVYRVDVIITDIMMPELEGTEFILRLRQSNIPIISVSGLAQEDVISKIISSLGIRGFLQKPFRPGDILKMIQNVDTQIMERSE
ncbi:MAG: response regulator [Chitinispirillaceae bacterium]